MNEFMINIRNLPQKTKKYVVATYCSGEFWFYGTYSNKEQADKVANQIDRVVLTKMKTKQEVQNVD